MPIFFIFLLYTELNIDLIGRYSQTESANSGLNIIFHILDISGVYTESTIIRLYPVVGNHYVLSFCPASSVSFVVIRLKKI